MNRFSLLSLLLTLTVVAVAYSAWNQSRQANEINRLRVLLNASDRDLRISCRIVELLLHLASGEADTIDLLRPLIPPTPDPTLESELQSLVRMFASTAQIADVDGTPGGLEILSLNTSITTIPGSSTSVNVLFNDDAIVDILSRSTGTRWESHNVTLRDADNDQLIDLVVACRPGFKSSEPAKKLVYHATERGFTLQNAGNGITMTSTEGREPSGLAVVESLARPRRTAQAVVESCGGRLNFDLVDGNYILDLKNANDATIAGMIDTLRELPTGFTLLGPGEGRQFWITLRDSSISDSGLAALCDLDVTFLTLSGCPGLTDTSATRLSQFTHTHVYIGRKVPFSDDALMHLDSSLGYWLYPRIAGTKSGELSDAPKDRTSSVGNGESTTGPR